MEKNIYKSPSRLLNLKRRVASDISVRTSHRTRRENERPTKIDFSPRGVRRAPRLKCTYETVTKKKNDYYTRKSKTANPVAALRVTNTQLSQNDITDVRRCVDADRDVVDSWVGVGGTYTSDRRATTSSPITLISIRFFLFLGSSDGHGDGHRFVRVSTDQSYVRAGTYSREKRRVTAVIVQTSKRSTSFNCVLRDVHFFFFFPFSRVRLVSTAS